MKAEKTVKTVKTLKTIKDDKAMGNKAPPPTSFPDCPIGSRSHEAHDGMIADLTKRIRQLESVVSMVSKERKKIRDKYTQLLNAMKDKDDEVVSTLSRAVLELENQLQRQSSGRD